MRVRVREKERESSYRKILENVEKDKVGVVRNDYGDQRYSVQNSSSI